MYPFGYGLSYSKFRYESLKLKSSIIKAGENLMLQVSVTNLGPYDADEVCLFHFKQLLF